jgi:hypothetical protein
MWESTDVLVCGGKITNKYTSEGKGFVELELSLKNQSDVNCVPGKGLVELPLRASE